MAGTPSNNLYQHPWSLALHTSAMASKSTQASSSLGPLPLLSTFVLQSACSLLLPLGPHGSVSKKMALRLKVPVFLF